MSSDSTSSEDEYERIKEAVDENFLTKDLYINSKSKKKSESQPKPKSLRNQSHQEVSKNPFALKVTPEFQQYVSKHLSKLLDSIIDDNETIFKIKKRKRGNLNNGVKLLGSSKDFLLCHSNPSKNTNSKKFTLKNSLDETDYEKKAKEVAVTPEWVLSQEETRYWAPNTKGNIEIVKLDNSKHFTASRHKKLKP